MNQTQGTPGKQKFVPFITAEGVPASIKQADIPENKWIHCHGETAAGKQVNSMQIQEIGSSLLARGNSGPIISLTADEAEVGFTIYLRKKGFKVIPPNMGQ